MKKTFDLTHLSLADLKALNEFAQHRETLVDYEFEERSLYNDLRWAAYHEMIKRCKELFK